MYDEVTLEVYGNICREPERKMIPVSGKEYLELTIASTFAPRKDKNGDVIPPKDGAKPMPNFTIVHIYDEWVMKRAELARTGEKIYAKGRAEVNVWMNKTTNKPSYRLICKAFRFFYLPKLEREEYPTL